MGEFEPITTQEAFDQAVSDRIATEKAGWEKSYENYLSPEDVEEKYKGYLTPEQGAEKDKQIASLNLAAIKAKVAHEKGIPYELTNRLNGTTEEEITKDAESLAGFIKANKKPEPTYQDEPSDNKNSGKTASYRKILAGMKSNE